MQVGILGAGAVALGTAAYLEERGVSVRIWSPSGTGLDALTDGNKFTAKGAIERSFRVDPARSAADAITGADIVLVALPAYAHAMAFEAMAPHLREDQVVAISSHSSFGALVLDRLLAERGVQVPIVAWSTTFTAGRRQGLDTVVVSTVRASIDVAAVPKDAGPSAVARLTEAFGARFRLRDGLLAIALSNLNPQNHLAIALCNFTRMDLGETWRQGDYVSQGVGRLMEALDAERLDIARAFGLETRTIFDHFSQSYHLDAKPVSEMYADLMARGGGSNGPRTADSRYVTEDVPYGLVPTSWLGQLVGCRTALHDGGIALFSAIYGRDFADENDLLDRAGVTGLTPKELIRLCEAGAARR